MILQRPASCFSNQQYDALWCVVETGETHYKITGPVAAIQLRYALTSVAAATSSQNEWGVLSGDGWSSSGQAPLADGLSVCPRLVDVLVAFSDASVL